MKNRIKPPRGRQGNGNGNGNGLNRTPEEKCPFLSSEDVMGLYQDHYADTLAAAGSGRGGLVRVR